MDITLPVNLDLQALAVIFAASIFTWIIFGIVIGTLAHLIDREKVKGGVLGSIVTAIIGAILGGLIGNFVFGISAVGINAESFLVAMAGAVLLVIAERIIFRNPEHIKTKVTRLD